MNAQQVVSLLPSACVPWSTGRSQSWERVTSPVEERSATWELPDQLDWACFDQQFKTQSIIWFGSKIHDDLDSESANLLSPLSFESPIKLKRSSNVVTAGYY